MNVVKLYLFVAHAIPLSLYNRDIINVKLVPKMGLHGCTHYTVMDFKSNVMLETTTASILFHGDIQPSRSAYDVSYQSISVSVNISASTTQATFCHLVHG